MHHALGGAWGIFILLILKCTKKLPGCLARNEILLKSGVHAQASSTENGLKTYTKEKLLHRHEEKRNELKELNNASIKIMVELVIPKPVILVHLFAVSTKPCVTSISAEAWTVTLAGVVSILFA